MNRRTLYGRELSGFSLVELLVVLLIVGILASLGFFGYGAWRNNVAQTEVKSDLSGVYAAMESSRNWSSGYPVLAEGVSFDGNVATKDIFTQSDKVTLTYFKGDTKGYCIDAVSKAKPSVAMRLVVPRKDDNFEPGTCAAANPIAAARAFVSKGSSMSNGGCSASTCAYVAINTQNFPAGSYQVRCFSSSLGAFSALSSYFLPANGQTQLTCYHGISGDSVYVQISGWGDSEPLTW